MRKRAIIWSALFAAELLAVLFHMNISRYYSDLTARLVFGSLLEAGGGMGLLLEVFKIEKKKKIKQQEDTLYE